MRLFGLLLFSMAVVLPTGCAHKPVGEAVRLPENETAFITGHHSKGAIFNSRQFHVTYIDGERLIHQKEATSVFGGFRLLPGKHSIGIIVQHGNVCIPAYLALAEACFNSCFSGISLLLEAGRRYKYEIEKDQNNVFVNVIDDTGKVVSKGFCEPCSFALCGQEQQKAIMERLENNIDVQKNRSDSPN